jgi:hypothetical protein
MSEPREPVHPPSDPRPALRRTRLSRVPEDRPFRVELAAALVLGVALVVSGLFLWRRPRAATDPAAEAPSATAVGAEDSGATAAVVDAGPPPVVLSEARVLGCHDPGPRKTPPDQCDHVSSIEKALASAVERSASCASHPAVTGATSSSSPPGAASGGTIEYVADVSFRRHKVSVILPRAGRSVHDRKVLAACASAVRGAMTGVALDGVGHEHARYQIAVIATYRSGS